MVAKKNSSCKSRMVHLTLLTTSILALVFSGYIIVRDGKKREFAGVTRGTGQKSRFGLRLRLV